MVNTRVRRPGAVLAGLLLVAVVLVAGCSGDPDAARPVDPTTAAPATAAPTTAAPADEAPATGDPAPARPGVCASPANGEMRGTGSLWALFFPVADQPGPVVANTETKIVWKIGGDGDFTIAATGPDGATATLVWGPTGHGGSTWARPGAEFGTGFTFPKPGCWAFTATRSSGEKGELWLTVA